MFGFGLLGNTHIPHHKNTAEMAPVRMTPPKEVLLPMAQHIGAPAIPTVKVGDEVKIGDMIGEAAGYVSAPVFASVSGKVTKIENYLRPDGRVVPAIRILSDGNMTMKEGIEAPEVTDLETFILAVKNSGIVGLGGAGFPTSVKLDALKRGEIDTIIINGAECEPYITSDTRTMLDSPDLIEYGVELFEKFVPGVKSYIFGIEANKPAAIKKMREVFLGDENVKVVKLPSVYPQGGEKIIIYNTTKRIVKEGELPANVGVLVINVTSLAIIAKYIKDGIPLVERCVTVDGSAVREPKNVIAPIGTAVGDIIEFAGGLKEELGKLLLGGPMMGTPLSSLTEPITKTTGAITVMSKKDATESPVTQCIHCGRCVTACPLGLNPVGYARALELDGKADRVAKLEELKINLCMECGCCSYVCPANRPLVQNNRIGKSEVREYKNYLKELGENKV